MDNIKRISVAALAAITLWACQTSPDINPAAPFKLGETIIVNATGESNDTKTVLAEDGSSILWSAGDALNLWYGSSAGRFVSTNAEPAAKAQFQGSLNNVTGTAEGASPEAGQSFYSIYPFSENNSLQNNTISMIFPQVQNAVEGSFDPAAFPAAACSGNLDLEFRNACGLLKIVVGNEGVYAISLHGNNNEPLSGPGQISFDGNTPLLTMGPYSSSPYNGEIVLKSETPLGTGKPYYMAVPPTEFTQGAVLTLYDKNSQAIETFTLNKALAVKRNKVHSLTLKKSNPGIQALRMKNSPHVACGVYKLSYE